MAGLALLMLMTRGELLSALVPVQLHDASWAAFVLAGAVLRRPIYLAGLALLALGLDYSALCAGSLNLTACLKPSYPALIASWALLFTMGRLLITGSWSGAGISRNLTLVLSSVVAAYLLTSGGFFLFSGFYQGWTVAEYWNMSSGFFLMAMGTTLGYTAAGLIIDTLTTTDRSVVSGGRQTA